MTTVAESFRPVSCMIMGTLAGFLIGVPVAINSNGSLGIFALVAATLAGFLTGYRRRHSLAFFYFSLVCVLVLASTVSLNLFEWRK